MVFVFLWLAILATHVYPLPRAYYPQLPTRNCFFDKKPFCGDFIHRNFGYVYNHTISSAYPTVSYTTNKFKYNKKGVTSYRLLLSLNLWLSIWDVIFWIINQYHFFTGNNCTFSIQTNCLRDNIARIITIKAFVISLQFPYTIAFFSYYNCC